MKTPRLNRRDFLRASATAAFGFYILPAAARGANSRIQVGCIGVGGKGYLDRFPDDFAFRLTLEESCALKFHSGISKPGRGGVRKPALVLG